MMQKRMPNGKINTDALKTATVPASYFTKIE
jgi:hypothetical protein